MINRLNENEEQITYLKNKLSKYAIKNLRRDDDEEKTKIEEVKQKKRENLLKK